MFKPATLAPALAAALILAGCAEKSADIAPSYVSSSRYDTMNCRQLGAEAQTVSDRARSAIQAQDKKASNDAAAATVGMILFWPALFMIKGDGSQAAEVARLKGEREAIEAANRARNCGIVFKE